MTALAQRRGACPALSAPMQTGDGLLVRLNPVAGGLCADALIGLCQSASRRGNGIMEITARGSIQIRGLTARSAGLLADDVDALGIAVRTGVPVETGPLAGLDPDAVTDPRPLADAIRADVEKTDLPRRLGPKVSVIVDGGGRIALDDLAADLRLMAVRHEQETLWHLAVGGTAATARPIGLLTEERAASEAVSILEAIAMLGREGRGRDLGRSRHSVPPPSGLPAISPSRGKIGGFAACSHPAKATIGESVPSKVISPLGGEMAGRPEGGVTERKAIRPAGQPGGFGIFPLADSTHALGIALPFGSMPADRIAELAAEAAGLGATDLRPAPGRMLLVTGLNPGSAVALQKRAAALGFVSDPADPRLSIAACPGKPACAAGRIETRAIAEHAARRGSALLDGSFTLHVSGCAKGCARPAPAMLTLVGGENGAGLVVDGTAGAIPSGYMSEVKAAQALDRVAALVAKERRLGETAAACLARLGAAAIATAFAQGQA